MLPLLDETFSASTYHIFFPSSLSSDPFCSQLPEQDADTPPPTVSHFHMGLEWHKVT